jgi:hypothetical protein
VCPSIAADRLDEGVGGYALVFNPVTRASGIPDVYRDWQRIRALRNMAAHDYSIHYADIALHFNGLKEVLPELLGVVVRLVNYCDTKLSIAPKKVFFESDWQHIINCHGK